MKQSFCFGPKYCASPGNLGYPPGVQLTYCLVEVRTPYMQAYLGKKESERMQKKDRHQFHAAHAGNCEKLRKIGFQSQRRFEDPSARRPAGTSKQA